VGEVHRAKRRRVRRTLMQRVAVVALAGLAAACSPAPPPLVRAAGWPVRAECPDRATPEHFLPSEALVPPRDPGVRTLHTVYPDLLRAMKIASLSCGPGSAEAYRVARLQWTGAPVVMDVSGESGRRQLSYVRLEAPSWNLPPGEIVDAHTVDVSEDEWRAFQSALSTAGFWTMPSLSHGRDAVDGDGATWIVEGRLDGGYYIVSRGSPPEVADSFRAIGQLLLRLAHVSEDQLQADALGIRMRQPRPQQGQPPPPAKR
jgi:hypothetical protein